MTKIHSLDTNGNISGTKATMARLLKNFMVSDYSQSLIYKGNVSSLRYIYKSFDGDIDKLNTNLESALSALYGRYFRDAEIIVGTTLNESNKVEIEFSIRVIDDYGVSVFLEDSVNRDELEELYNSKI